MRNTVSCCQRWPQQLSFLSQPLNSCAGLRKRTALILTRPRKGQDGPVKTDVRRPQSEWGCRRPRSPFTCCAAMHACPLPAPPPSRQCHPISGARGERSFLFRSAAPPAPCFADSMTLAGEFGQASLHAQMVYRYGRSVNAYFLNLISIQGCQTQFNCGMHQHYGCPQKAGCICKTTDLFGYSTQENTACRVQGCCAGFRVTLCTVCNPHSESFLASLLSPSWPGSSTPLCRWLYYTCIRL